MEFMTAMAWQVIGRINDLEDGLDDEGFPENCCPICCYPCYALNRMISDPVMLNQLNDAVRSTNYHVDGWAYWDYAKDGLRVEEIKAMWFKPDGSHKAICLSVNGVDKSDEIHKGME